LKIKTLTDQGFLKPVLFGIYIHINKLLYELDVIIGDE